MAEMVIMLKRGIFHKNFFSYKNEENFQNQGSPITITMFRILDLKFFRHELKVVQSRWLSKKSIRIGQNQISKSRSYCVFQKMKEKKWSVSKYLSFLQILIMVKNNDENFSLKVYLHLIWDSKATNWSNFNEIKIEVFRLLLCPLELVSPT